MRVAINIIFACICFFVFSSTLCRAKEWNGIVPLQTTRSEVIKTLGTPKKVQWTDYEYFELNGDTIAFGWIDPTCRRKIFQDESEKPISTDLVINISVSPKPYLSFNDQNYPFQKAFMVSCIGSGSKTSCSYIAPEIGFSFVSSNRLILSMLFYPADKEFKTWKDNHPGCFQSQNQSN